MSIRALAKRHRVHRRTVRQALADAVPPPRKVPDRAAPVTGRMLILSGAGWWRIWRCRGSSGIPPAGSGSGWSRSSGARVGESTVRNLVARLRVEIGADRCRVMVPQTHPPAAEAEVDFGEFSARRSPG